MFPNTTNLMAADDGQIRRIASDISPTVTLMSRLNLKERGFHRPQPPALMPPMLLSPSLRFGVRVSIEQSAGRVPAVIDSAHLNLFGLT